MKKLISLNTSPWKRSLSLAKSYLGGGTRILASQIATSFLNEEKKDSARMKTLINEMEKVTQLMGELKGTVQKIGQSMSVYGERFLPPELNEILKKLQTDSPPLDWPAIEKSLQVELGEKLSQLEVSSEAIGAASLGQVHEVKIKGSLEKYAVKVQYTDVEKAIDSDLKILKRMFSMMSFVPKGPQFDKIFLEVEEMLHQELDYESERQWLQFMSEKLSQDNRYVLPKPVKEFCTKKILLMTFEEGLRIDDPEVLNLPQDDRNQIAELALQLFFRELLEWGVVQTDPHFGNYRVRLNGRGPGLHQLVLFDFGATRRLESAYQQSYKQMARGAFFENFSQVVEGAEGIGFLTALDSVELKRAFYDACLMFSEPFRNPISSYWFGSPTPPPCLNEEGVYDFSASDLPERVAKAGADLVLKFKFRAPPRENVFIDRKSAGIFFFVVKLGAKIKARQLAAPFFEK
jgi:predicted unusual protein kinase regulating ubiquinone biosynthesis (AarF/ABC1/UbiB family)